MGGNDDGGGSFYRDDVGIERYPPIRLSRNFKGNPSGMGAQPPSVILVEDHSLMRESQRTAIEADGRLALAGEASDGEAGLDLIRAKRPDVASVDMKMKRVDGWGVLDAVMKEGLPTRIVFVTAFDEIGVVQQALRSGASGFISKGTTGPDLCELLLRAASGQRAVSSDLQGALVARMGEDDRQALSERELQILRCMAEGKSAAETAEVLHLSEPTVRSHQAAVKRKLGAANGTQAVTLGFRLGLLS